MTSPAPESQSCPGCAPRLAGLEAQIAILAADIDRLAEMVCGYDGKITECESRFRGVLTTIRLANGTRLLAAAGSGVTDGTSPPPVPQIPARERADERWKMGAAL
jgi:hypothetical protein